MLHRLSTVTSALVLAASVAAQGDGVAGSTYNGPANLVFTFDFNVGLNSTFAGDAAIVGDEGVMTYSPGVSPFALPLCDFSTWGAFLGDEDNDGSYSDSIITSVDAVWAPPGAPTPPTLFDIFVSVQTGTGTAGYVPGGITDGDIFRLTSTGVETYLSQAQVATATGGVSTTLDINGFTVDPSNNDLYMTFTATADVNGTSLSDGGILRIPGSALTITGGLVSAVAPGSAQIVLTEAEVDGIFLAAGSNGVSDLTGIEIDPAGGTYTLLNGRTIPNLWLVDDDSADELIVSTVGGGSIPSVNGVALQGGNAFGLLNTSPTGPFSIGNPFGIAFQAADPVGPNPMVCDSFPSGITTPTAAPININAGGANPGSFVIYVGEFFDATISGGFAPRSGTFPLPVSGPSWGEFYPSIPTSGLIGSAIADGEGFAEYFINIPIALPAGTGVIFQAADLSTLTVSAPHQISTL